MYAQRFQFPVRHLPFLGTADYSGSSYPLLRFKQQVDDKGLANAVRFYWLAKKIVLTVSMSVTDLAWVEVDPPTDPPTWNSGSHTFSWSKTWATYGGDAEATSIDPTPSTVEEDWGLPHQRACPLEGWDDFARNWIPPMLMAFTSSATVDGVMHFTPWRIEFNATEDRWCLALTGGSTIEGLATEGDFGFASEITARMEAWDYSLGSYEAEADFVFPTIFDDYHAPKVVYNEIDRFNPSTETEVICDSSVSYEFQVEYWQMPP